VSVPNSLLGLVLFVALLAPGLVAIQTGPRKKPVAKPTALHEIAGIIFRSLISLVMAACAIGIARVIFPHRTLDVGALVREPNSYLTQHYVSATWWGLATLALACALAWGWSRFSSTKVFERISESKVGSAVKTKKVIETVPAWWILFKPKEAEDGSVRVMADITVENHIVYSGEVYTFSPEIDEHADRELTLIEPIIKKTPKPENPSVYDESDLGASLFGISAREIRHIAVRWESVPDDQPENQGGEPVAPSGEPG